MRVRRARLGDADYNVLLPTSSFRVIDTTSMVLGYTLRYRDVRLAHSGHRWVQFDGGSTLTVQLSTGDSDEIRVCAHSNFSDKYLETFPPKHF